MKLLIAAIGKAKPSPELSLFQEYVKRMAWKVTLKELDVRPASKEKEAEKLLAACEGYARLVALDETGRQFTSPQFARQLGEWQQAGHSSLAFVIGGADGLHESVRARAQLVWALGSLTWPHMLVRALLAEQLYRAQSILSGHPYHRI
jgi:23S rRNA (pseudouridine1915-N3)-methyltransferase